MRWLKFSLAVVLTSAALVVALFATGTFLVGNALASTITNAAQMRGHGSWDDQNLPPEIASLKDVPADERFSHFQGVQVALTDKEGKPVHITLTPGIASSVSPSSLTIAGNDGSSHTYTLNDQTWTHGAAIADGEKIVVLTMNETATARAVVDLNNMHSNT